MGADEPEQEFAGIGFIAAAASNLQLLLGLEVTVAII
jgi:hypothetical protein